MKKNIFYVFLFIQSIFYAQELSVVYQLKYKPIVTSDNFQEELMVLDMDLNNKTSLFYSYAKVKTDSIYTLINTTNSDSHKAKLRQSIPNQSFHFIIKKSSDTKKVYVVERFNIENYAYEQEVKLNWRIQNKTKNILGYNCQNACVNFGGREWIAWFANDIPISDGPYKFYGLPGLIISLESVDGEYLFQGVSILNKSHHFDMPKKKIKVKSHEKVMKLKREYVKQPSAKSRQEDLMYGISGSATVNGVKYSPQKSYQLLDDELWDWMKNHNNPIEKNDIWVR